jgi:hypothetical protein|nr:MAG TPA: hypothetical protein [Caudoviricetes sp.]
MIEIFNNIEYTLKIANSQLFLDYLALDLLDYPSDYKFSDYLNIFNIINKDKNIKKFNNIKSKNNYLDLVCNSSSFYSNVKLYYNRQNLLAYFEFDCNYYAFLINVDYINNFMINKYKNIPHFISKLEEYISNTN